MLRNRLETIKTIAINTQKLGCGATAHEAAQFLAKAQGFLEILEDDHQFVESKSEVINKMLHEVCDMYSRCENSKAV